MNLYEIGPIIKKYRIASGLSQSELAALAFISRATLIPLEKGQLKEFGAAKLFTLTDILGIGLSYNEKDSASDDEGNIKKAVISSNVSYKNQLSPKLLEDVLVEGKIPKGYEGNILHFIDEAPVQTILGVIRAVAAKKHKNPKEIWGKATGLAKLVKSPRRIWHVSG